LTLLTFGCRSYDILHFASYDPVVRLPYIAIIAVTCYGSGSQPFLFRASL